MTGGLLLGLRYSGFSGKCGMSGRKLPLLVIRLRDRGSSISCKIMGFMSVSVRQTFPVPFLRLSGDFRSRALSFMP